MHEAHPLFIYIYFFSQKKRSSRRKRSGLIKGIGYASRKNRRIILKKLAREKMRAMRELKKRRRDTPNTRKYRRMIEEYNGLKKTFC